MNPNLEELRDKALNLPLRPGVYIMQDDEGNIIYIGKAKKLKNRVSSYFHGDHLPKVAAMVEKVKDFNVIVVSSEFEALVLENSLIKQHKPHYNILLKDDKGYPFICVNFKAEYPTLTLSNRADRKDIKYFGPFAARSQSYDIINAIRKALLLPDCSRVFPRDIGKERPCLNYHMGTCAGWCLSDANAEEYRNKIKEAMLILSGRSDELIEELTTQMQAAAEELRFEYAAELRDRMRAVQALSEHQRVIATVFSDTDAIGFKRGAKSCFNVLHFRGGSLTGKDVEMLEDPLEEDEEALVSLVCRWYMDSSRNAWPKMILLPKETGEEENMSRLFTERAGHTVSVEVPQRGERLRLIQSAEMNASEEIQRRTTQEQRRLKTLEWLQKALNLPDYPKRIEAFDISNLGDTGIVAAMTVHVDGKPAKSEYRKFRMKDLEGQDDYASMYQAVYRRFHRYVDGDPKFSPLPDLLLIDGGDVHAGVAERALADLQLYVPVFGMVKDNRHRTRALINSSGQETGISANQALFALIGNIQEETHRTAISYQRSLRSESLISELDSIPGIGPKRRDELLKAFHSVKAIREASVTQLNTVVPSNAAQTIYNYFHTKGDSTTCE